MSKHVTMQQWAGSAAAHAKSALSGSDLSAHQSQSVEEAGLVLEQMPLCGLLTIRTNASNASLRVALKQVLKLEPPSTLQAIVQGDCCLRWMGPDEWLLSCAIDQVFDIETRLREALEGHVALVNVSCGYQCLEVRGPDVMTVLQKSTGYDVHPSHLNVGKVVNTTFAKSQVTLRCIGVERYELIVRRSFADYVWQWLNEAAREHGLFVSCGTPTVPKN